MFVNTPFSRRRKLAVSVAIAPLLFAACGGSTSGPAGGATAATWCDFADESDVVDEIFSSLGSDPSQMKEGITEIESYLQRLPGEAPDEIKDDAKKLSEGTQMLVDAIKAADYSILDADLAFMDDPALEDGLDEASDKLDDYTLRECGRSFTDDGTDTGDESDPGDTSTGDDGETGDDSGDFNPGDGTLREQLVAQFESIGLNNDEATCIADRLDFSDPSVQSGDIASMLDVFDECGIGLDRLAELGGG